jgi:outer membrane protein OmpA-like peptidoglycan-associated protein
MRIPFGAESWSVRVFGTELQIGLGAPSAGRGRELLPLLRWAVADRDRDAMRAVESIASALGPMNFMSPSEAWDRIELAARDGVLGITEVRHPELDPYEGPPPSDPPPPAVSPDSPTQATPRHFEIRFVDEVGDPIDEIEIRFLYLGAPHSATTDASGVATFEGDEVSFATATVVDTKALRAKLAPRWKEPREPQIPAATDEAPVYVETLDDHFDPVRLEHNVPATVVITPRFACRELTATTFDFARSFPKRAGLQTLTTIAQELQQDDGQKCLIYGHTDTSGGEELNKRLSERRARAIFALLTHDAALWESMWTGKNTDDWPHWFESWGTLQMQHMLNSLQCFDDANVELDEDGQYGSSTVAAVKRFQRGDYPAKPAEQAPLPETGASGQATREQMFLAYAKLVTRQPVDTARISKIGDAPFMGCGEFNPLSLTAKDRESRRVVIFIFDPAAEPTDAPCKLKDTSPCRANFVDPPPTEADGPPFYRCAHFRKLAHCCTPMGGPDLAHDVIVRFHLPVVEANSLPEEFVLESDDDPDDDVEDANFEQRQALATDAKASVPPNEDENADDENVDTSDENVDETAESLSELHFTHVPDGARYRLRVEGVDPPYAVFTKIPFHDISELSAPQDRMLFPGVIAILTADPFGL